MSKGPGEIHALIGKSAGEICYHNFFHENFCTQALVNAAESLWERVKSPWVLVEIWNNGTTLWQSPQGDATAAVTAEGEVVGDLET